MELTVLESPGQEWDEFASRYTDLIFYQSLWSEVLREGLGGQPLYFCLKEGGEIVAGLPGILLGFKIFKILYASIPYGNLIGEKSRFPLFEDLLGREFHKRGIHQVRITDSPFLEPYQPESFKSVSAKCTLLDLREVDQNKIFEGYKKYIRRDIRKAWTSGVIIRSAASRDDIHRFHKLYLASMERNKAVAKYPLRWIQALYEKLGEKELATIFLAELNHVPIAGVVLIHSLTSTHYFHSGSRYEYLKYCPNEMLIHSSLEMAAERGDLLFDFMGSDSADLSLIHFKEKWGGRSMDIRTYVKDYSPIRCKLWEWGKDLAYSGMGRGLLKIFRE